MPPALIDTQALIVYGFSQLSERADRVIREQGNFYSHVSVWEMAIKSGLGKLALYSADGQRMSAKQFMLRLIGELRLSALPLEFDDMAAVEGLPPHHNDPFDRLLVVQAQRNNLPIVSADPVFERYGVKRVW
jgi:PIN domain nuclease of toxin-antitoxin system